MTTISFSLVKFDYLLVRDLHVHPRKHPPIKSFGFDTKYCKDFFASLYMLGAAFVVPIILVSVKLLRNAKHQPE